MQKLSVAVITKNEASNITAALESVAWADELLVVDSHSTDDTVAIVRRFTDRVVVRDWEGYGVQKNYAASVAQYDWILSLDADERVSPELASEIKTLLRNEPAHHGYRIPRVAFHLGRWIRSTDWYPDYQLRLYDRRKAQWDARLVHESVRLDGTIGTLRGELQHYAYRDLSHHLQTIDRYTTLAARQMLEQGRRARMIDFVVHPPLAFLRNYVLKLGMRDGLPGFVISATNAFYVFMKFAKLRELQRNSAARRGASP